MNKVPKFKVNVICHLVFNKKRVWVVAPANTLILDLTKLSEGQQNYYFSHQEFRFVREDCKRLDSPQEQKKFFEHILFYETSTEELAHALCLEVKRKSRSWQEDFMPSVVIDIDKRAVVVGNAYYEKFKDYLPAGWTYEFKNFLDDIPPKFSYWKLL